MDKEWIKMGKVNWYIITGIVGLFGVLITALTTTLIGQITLGIVSTQIYEWFAGETIWQTLWNNPFAVLEVLF